MKKKITYNENLTKNSLETERKGNIVSGYLTNTVINEKYFDSINMSIFKSIATGRNTSFGI